MLKVDAITFFGSKTKLANAAGVRLASVAAWGILVPEGRAMRLQEASGGELLNRLVRLWMPGYVDQE